MTETETPIEEWQTVKSGPNQGKLYTVLKGPGGGTVFRQGEETPQEARARRAISIEAKRRKQAETPKPKGPIGKGRKKDPTPGPSSAAPKSASAKPKPTKDQLAAAAEVPLQALGAFVGRGMLGCDYCAGTMMANSAAAARDLASSSNPYMVSLLTWWWQLVHAFAGGDGLVKYLAPPLVHHALPDPAAAFISPFLGVPPRSPAPERRHEHGSPPRRAETRGPIPGDGTAGPPPPPPGGGNGAMTPDEAYAQAQAAMAARPPTPEEAQRMMAERQRLAAEAQRLASIQQTAARQAAAAASPNMPPYRADQPLPQSAPREAAPGTPQAPPPPPGADAMGSPLPPEAGG